MTTMSSSSGSPSKICTPSSNNLSNGCSRTIPVSWSAPTSLISNSIPSTSSSSSTGTLLGISSIPSSSAGIAEAVGASQPLYTESPTQTQHHVTPSSSVSSSSSSSLTVLQIKREPCQVSEVTTSNNLGHYQHQRNQRVAPPALAAVVKIESSSPKSTVMESHTHTQSAAGAGAIPVGIAVARQRLQEHTSASHQHQSKEINRFGIGIADIGGATSSVSQNMFFAGTNSTMIPLNSDSLSLGVPNVQNAVRTPPTFWQYPTPVPVESMLPMPVPPVGFQLVRDPNTGQFLFLPTTTAIEPFQSAVVWPTYSQPAATAIQQPHLLLPPIAQPLQPPPLAPLQLLGSDYLTTASTTLHQHTQTHSTRFVALTADAKRRPISSSIPLPVPHHAVIKIEDCVGSGNNATATHHHHSHHHHQQHQQHQQTAATAAALIEEEKSHGSMNTSSSSSIATAAQTNDMSSNVPAQIFYHQPSGGLIQIAHQNSQSNTITECRSVANETSPSLLMPHQLISSSSPQLTSLASLNDSTTTSDGLTEASKNCVPEVQDANIQTDTPVMSEDDNTYSAEDCTLPTQQSLEEENNVIIPSSTTLSEHLSPPLACHDVSTNVLEEKETLENDTNSSKNDSGFGSNAVTSTNSLEEPSSATEEMNSNNMTVSMEEEHFSTYNVPVIEKGPENSSTPVDLSGLELLSNISIEAFEKKTVYIKKEPPDEKKNNSFESVVDELNFEQDSRKETDEKHLVATTVANEKYVSDQNEQLGGLNLLCALAEQRIQEEVVRRKRSSSCDSQSSKKKKHKHSKSSKKSKHDKERKERKRHRDSRDFDDVETGSGQDIKLPKEVLQEDLKETLERIKANYMKSTVCKSEGAPHCCREKCNWPTPEELLSAMEKDMRLRLADITRQCQEKKKELEEIAPILQHRKSQLLSDRESTPLSSKSSVKSYYSCERQQQQQQQELKIKHVASPKWFSSENALQSEETQKAPSDSESCKLDDLETSSTSSSRRKGNVPKKQDDNNTETIVAKKPKTLVGCILASKNRFNEIKDHSGLLTDDTSLLSEGSCKLSLNTLKTETSDLATVRQDNYEILPVKQEVKTIGLFDNNQILDEKRYHRKSSKHHSKHKKSKSNKEKKHRSSETKERKKKIDARCLLTSDLLDRLENNKIRVLTAMGGLFYAGTLTALQPPDIYSVTLDGERGNRPHIMTREDVLRDAILEVHPTSVEEIPPGTRICAYWSQQYRCLYPGITAERETSDIIHDRLFVGVEFDDGDNGKIALEDIRFLLSDYPIVEYDPNPLLTLGRRKRRTSANAMDYTIQRTDFQLTSGTATTSTVVVHAVSEERLRVEANKRECKERRRLKKLMRKDKLKKLEVEAQNSLISEKKHKHKHKCGEEFCKHRKHKKRRKHKKHHHRECALDSSQNTSPINFGENMSCEDMQQSSLSSSSSPPMPPIKVEDQQQEQGQHNTTVLAQKQNEEEDVEMNTGDEKKVEIINQSTFNPISKEDTTTEEDVASSTTESSESIYQPGKKKERQSSGDNHSKIAAFLPARQLWGWAGKAYRRAGAKGRAKKQFYKSIQRGKEIITVGDSAVFLSTGRPDRPYIGQIESMWETSSSNKVVRVRWFYHPEETVGCPNLKYPGALFQSPHEDENDVQTISHKCEVLPLSEYTSKFGQDPKQYQSIYDNNDTYYLAGYYDPTVQTLKLQQEIPTLAENDKWV